MLIKFISNCTKLSRLKISSNLRHLTYLKRVYPIKIPRYVEACGGKSELTVENQVYEEISDDDELPVLQVLLSDDVPGLGMKGNLVNVHRNRFWNYLYLLKLAELPTDERISELQSSSSGNRVLCGHLYTVQQHLLNMTLYVPMNPSLTWKLTTKHVKVAFRILGIIVEEKDISLPKFEVTPETLNIFEVTVNIEDIVSVPVKTRIFLYQRLDSRTCIHPPTNVFRKIRIDDWITDFKDEDLRVLPNQTLEPYR